jgi:hypothetical protein
MKIIGFSMSTGCRLPKLLKVTNQRTKEPRATFEDTSGRLRPEWLNSDLTP